MEKGQGRFFFSFNKIEKNTITKEKKRINNKSEEKERRKKEKKQ